MKELLTYIVQSLVEHPDEVSVTERKGDGKVSESDRNAVSVSLNENIASFFHPLPFSNFYRFQL